MSQRRKRLPQIIISQTLTTILIVLIATILLFYSQGYRINWKSMQVTKMGVLFVDTTPNFDQIIVNGISFEKKGSYYKTLSPGHYQIKIIKEGYSDWQREVEVKPDIVSSFKDIFLFRINPQIEELKEQKKIDYLNSPSNDLAQNIQYDLNYNNYEIWVNKKLITRFSNQISNVKWYWDHNHILYQQGNQIRIIETSGFNDTFLVELSSGATINFVVEPKGKELYFNDNGYKKAFIQ